MSSPSPDEIPDHSVDIIEEEITTPVTKVTYQQLAWNFESR